MIYIPNLPDNENEPSSIYMESYNPLLTNKTTPVKNQGVQGTCGIFATNARLETTGLYKTGLKC